ncbi:MAG TPA: hypothetical protein VMA55_00820 [Acidovorax sp.]|nr:hypothetical protein [Acidovorax sp.]
MSHMPYSICAARRTLREVQLVGRWVSTPRVILMMFDPEFVDVVGDGFLLRGRQTRSEADGRAYDHEQLWLVRPCQSDQGPWLLPFDARRWLKKMPVEESTGNEPSVSELWHKTHIKT